MKIDLKDLRELKEGFTLIELLVVISIIAVLILIVIVAINPVKRVQDSQDREAASNVKSTGLAVTACVAWARSQRPPLGVLLTFGTSSGSAPFNIAQTGTNGCGDFNYMSLSTNGSISASSLPSGVTVYNDSTTAPTQVCAWSLGGTQYYKWTSLTGAVAGTGATTTPSCP